MEQLTFEYELITSQDMPRIRFHAEAGEVLFERVLRLNDEQEFVQLCQDVSAKYGRDLRSVEEAAAQLVSDARAEWQHSQEPAAQAQAADATAGENTRYFAILKGEPTAECDGV